MISQSLRSILIQKCIISEDSEDQFVSDKILGYLVNLIWRREFLEKFTADLINSLFYEIQLLHLQVDSDSQIYAKNQTLTKVHEIIKSSEHPISYDAELQQVVSIAQAKMLEKLFS